MDADLGCAPRRGLAGLLANFFGREEVGGTIPRSDAKGTEFAAHVADVGEVDVAGDNVTDDVSGKLTADFVGGNRQPEEVVAGGRSEEQTLFAGENSAVEGLQNFFERRLNRGRDSGANVCPGCLR